MANVILAVLTGVLVAVTAYYAYQTHLTVKEMKAGRSAQVFPHLIPTMKLLGGGGGLLRVTNAGPGPALDVDVRLMLEPGGHERRWQTPVVAPGEHHEFIPAPEEEPNGLLGLDALTAKYSTYRLRGTYSDALGALQAIDETLDLRDFWETTKAAQHLQPDDHVRDIAKALKTVADEMRKWTESIHGLRVFTTDKDSHDRKTYLRMAFDSVARDHAGDDPGVVREALRKAAASFGQHLEPPEEWVKVICKDDDEGFIFRVPPA
jgi:hypothetical protein